MNQMTRVVRREFATLPGPIRVAYAWAGLVVAMMLSALLLTIVLGWVLGV